MHNTGKKKKITLAIIFLLLISINIGYCLDRHSDPSTSESSGSESSSSESSSSRSSGGGHSHESPSTPTTINFNIPGDPLEYRKFLANDKGNDLRRVYVEIYSKSDKPVKLNVREFIDPNLCIVMPSIHGYILSTIDEISLYKLGILESLELQENISASDINNYILLKFKHYKISLNKSNIVEINAFEDFASESYNIYNNLDLFAWNSCKDKNLTLFPNFKDYLKNLGIICGSEAKYIKFVSNNNTSINITNNGSNIATLFKRSHCILDKNSILLKYNGSICHLKYSCENNPVVYNSQMITINKVTIPPGSIFAFWYDLKLNKKGSYKTETISDSIIPGVIKPAYVPLIIDNNPKLSAIPRVSQSKLYVGDLLPIEFDLIYLDGGSSSISIPIKYQISENDYEYVQKNGDPDYVITENVTLFLNDSRTLKKYIKFKHKGIQLPPGIYVNGGYFATEKEIVVDTRFSRDPLLYAQTLFLFLTLVLFILSNVFLYNEFQKKMLRDKIKIHKRIVKSFAIGVMVLIIIFILWIFCFI